MPSNNLYAFGPGRTFLRDSTGNSFQLGYIESADVQIQGETKSLKGQYRWAGVPVVTGQKASGKLSFRELDSRNLQAFLGAGSTNGRSVPAEFKLTGTSGTVTPIGLGFDRDLGMLDASGRGMALTASAPAVGAYTRSGATYTTNASEPVGCTAFYTYLTGSGVTIAPVNGVQGIQSTFSLFLWQTDPGDGDLFLVEFPKVVLSDLSLGFKADDFGSNEMSFEAYCDPNGQPFKIHAP